MRPAVHPEDTALLEVRDVHVNRDHLLRLRIALFPDAHVERTAKDVRRRMRPALMLGNRQTRRIPRLGKGARLVGNRKAEIVAERWAWHAFELVLVEYGGPVAGEIDLRIRRRRNEK